MNAINYEKRDSKLLIGMLIFISVFVISHLVYSLGFRATVVIPMSLATLFFLLAVTQRKISGWIVLFVLAMLITSSITGLFWHSWRAAFFPAYFGVSLLLVSLATKSELNKTIAIGSYLLLIILLGACIAFSLGILGVESAGTFYAAAGRGIEFYYSSLAIPIQGNFIRASGLYDEPGTLSFIVCIFAFLRHIYGFDKRLTWVLLLLGFVTFSLAHLIYVFFHLLAERNVFKTLRNMLVVGTAVVFILISLGVWEYFENRLIGRLALSSNPDRIIAGDNRSIYLLQTIEYLQNGDIKEWLFGQHISCIEGTSECVKNVPGVGFNPVSPMVHYGFLIAWPYYLFLTFCIFIGIMRRDFWPLFAVGLLFMQRPVVLSSGYAMLAALVIIVVLRSPTFKKLYSRFFSNTSPPLSAYQSEVLDRI